MGDFEEKLESILNNPQAMQQIMSLAQSFGGNASPTGASTAVEQPSSPLTADGQIDPQMLSGIISLLGQYNSNDDQRVALLTALRPFLKEKRYAKIDKAIQIAKLSRMARSAFELFHAKEAADHV